MMELTLIQKIAIWALPILFAISLHEVAHGFAASWFGDHTARLAGRLSLNPLKHIDLVGTIIVPVLMLLTTNFIFGWAKPVPVDYRNMGNPRRDMAFVALAGPIANLLMAIAWGGIARLGMYFENMGNEQIGLPLLYMGGAGIMINIVLAVLNLIPIPPLDGGRILSSILPPRSAYYLSMVEPYSFFVLVLLLVSGIITRIMAPFVFLLIHLVSFLTGLS